MSQTFPGYSPPPIKHKSSYQHGSKSEQLPRYPLLCRNPRNAVIHTRYQRWQVMGTHRSYIWCHQEPTRSAGTSQGIHDATSQRMWCGKWSALWISYVILKKGTNTWT